MKSLHTPQSWVVTLVAVAVVLGLGCAWSAFGPASSVDAAEMLNAEAAAAGCTGNPGVFTGTDNNGNIENAIQVAVGNAMTCAGCCDRLVSYKVTEITGRVGGIAALNDVTVEIIASW